MKIIIFILSFTYSFLAFGSSMIACPSGQYVTGYAGGYYCQDHISNPTTSGPMSNCVACNENYYNQYNRPYMPYVHQQSYPFFNPQPTPWWAQQGPVYYNNFNYPGPWNQGAQGINPNYYHGSGGAVALKPNIYVQNAVAETEVALAFEQAQIDEMLVTTPSLDSDNKWKTKLTQNNKFSVTGVEYDYLFYDLRFNHTLLQYRNGFCSERKTIIDFMITDLNHLKFPKVSLDDFKEHWNEKIPKIKYYCVYPQYNKQLDNAYPITIKPKIDITRVLYLVVPFDDSPKVKAGQFPPLPVSNPGLIRPLLPSGDQMVLKEWGVAFLMDNVIK